MVTALADGPADGAVGSENDGNGNTRSDERQNDERIEDAVQKPKDPAEHGMNTIHYSIFLHCVITILK